MVDDHKLPDVLAPGLKVVFCGTAAGHRSAKQGCYYAGPGNKFWSVLADVALTPRRLRPEEFRELTRFGLGLTDLAKKASGLDSDLRSSDFDVEGFRQRLLASAPRYVAFNGKKAAGAYLGIPTHRVGLGEIGIRIGASRLFVLPSTSGAASGYWSEAPWRELAKLVE